MKTTHLRIGTADCQTGSLSIAYMLEHQIVSLHATDPRDKRKAGITLLLTRSEYAELKAMLLELDKVVVGNQPPEPVSDAPPPRVVRSPESGEVRIATAWGSVVVSTAVAAKAKELALMESRAEAIRYIAMGLAGVSKFTLAEAVEELVKEQSSGNA